MPWNKGVIFLVKTKQSVRHYTRRIVLLGLLTALEIVLTRFLSVNTEIFKIGFGFLAVALAGWFFGPIGGMIVGGLGDLIGALLFPVGAYFPGFTVIAVLEGALYGFFLCPRYGFSLHPKASRRWGLGGFLSKQNSPRILVAVLLKHGVCSQFLSTLCVWFLYSNGQKSYWVYFTSRLLTQTIFMIAAEILLLHLVLRLLSPYYHKIVPPSGR